MKSPLRYAGGKTRACSILDEILNDNFDMRQFKNIVSPFLGGGSFEFFVQSKYNLNIIANDKFEPLFNFWSICKNDNSALCTELYKLVDNISKDDFAEKRKRIVNNTDKLLSAVDYFVINRCSFSGSTLSGGFSAEASKKRFTKSSIDRVKSLDLTMFDISNMDFEEFLNIHKSNDGLLFLDPPYYLDKVKLYGNNGDMHENFNHQKLFDCIKKRKNWILTYNNCDYIKDLYMDFEIIDAEWSYGMNKSKKSSEIVIISK
jgi:DNA adenine methylase